VISYPGLALVSFIPGRVRVRVEKLRHNARFAQQIQRSLTAIPVIHSVETKTDTGSVLIRYDHSLVKERHNVELLLTALKSLLPEIDVDKIRAFIKE